MIPGSRAGELGWWQATGRSSGCSRRVASREGQKVVRTTRDSVVATQDSGEPGAPEAFA